MKRLVLIFVLSIITFTVFAQEEINGKKYLLPDILKSEGCLPFDGSDSITAEEYFIVWYFDSQPCIYFVHNSAQKFHTDDSLKIIGIAGYMQITSQALTINNYLGIADTSFNILEEKVLTDTAIMTTTGQTSYWPYYEVLFDNSKKVIGDFYVITDFARPYRYIKNGTMYEDTAYKAKYNWDGSYNSNFPTHNSSSIPLITTDQRGCAKQVLLENSSKYVLQKNTTDVTIEGNWEDPYDTTGLSSLPDVVEYLSKIRGIYLFPLIGDDDTTSVIDTTGTDTTSSIISPQVENFTYVFPNPAKENITIQSSFKMRNIEIYNEQGQKVKEYKPASYNTTIDISNLAKGNYIIKIITKSGIATKKILVQ